MEITIDGKLCSHMDAKLIIEHGYDRDEGIGHSARPPVQQAFTKRHLSFVLPAAESKRFVRVALEAKPVPATVDGLGYDLVFDTLGEPFSIRCHKCHSSEMWAVQLEATLFPRPGA